MSSTLPTPADCCEPESCPCPTTVQVPGPAGSSGSNGTNGTDGDDAWTTFTVAFTIPAEGASAVATVANSNFIAINDIVYAAKSDGSVVAYLQAVAVGGPTSVTLKNIEDTATGVYAPNSAPGSIFTIGSKIVPAGLQGPTGLLSGAAAGGDLKGTYPNPKLGVAFNAKGTLIAGNGTDSVGIPAGTNGHMLAYDSTDAEGIKSLKALPVTGDTDAADNRIGRLDASGATLPYPIQPSKVTITDNGAVRADGSGGNARGTDAIDLQVNRSGATQVASGNFSTIAGGQNNTASAAGATTGGGGGNTASGISSTVAGGGSNTASALTSGVGGGLTNLARSQSSYVGGGENNIAGDAGGANARCTVGGGDTNVASGQESVIAGGNQNQATGTQSAICGGDSNLASATESFVGGGNGNTASGTQASVAGGGSNTASGQAASIPGGSNALADKYGQFAWSGCNAFAAQGDAQTSLLMWRGTTTDATANVEIFIDGASLRASVPNNKSWVFDILAIGRSSAGVTAAWRIIGTIQNNAGTTALVTGGVTNTLINDGTGGTWGAVGNAPVIDADNANDSLRARVTGAGATTIRWVLTARITEVGH